MIAMFDIFTLQYKEAKELISKWFYRFPKGNAKILFLTSTNAPKKGHLWRK